MIKRDILKKIEVFLKTDDILFFYGARQVGKTSLMKYIIEHFFKEGSIFIYLEKGSNSLLLGRIYKILMIS